jgi:ceramide glucosyltransferase
VIPQFSLGHICNERTAQGLLSHELRWARTIRSIDPVGYFGSLISHPFPLAILASVTGSHGAVALAVAAIAILCRGALLNCVERRFRLGRQSYWLLPARDLLSFSVFLWGLFGNTVNWNGATYQLMSDGTLVEDRRTPLP